MSEDREELARCREVLRCYDLDEVVAVAAYGNGRINRTFRVRTTGPEYVLQALHPVFAAAVLLDIDRVTRHLHAKGVVTPTLVPTAAGALGVERAGRCWRVLSFIPGRSLEHAPDAAAAASAAVLVGRFHDALVDLDYRFAHALAGFHDTAAIMARLGLTAQRCGSPSRRRALRPLVRRVLEAYDVQPGLPPDLPQRVIHGDLKLANVRFDATGLRATALLDLDTLGRAPVVVDLGDALRSWCNRADEGDADGSAFSLETFAAFLEAYLGTARFLTPREKQSLPTATELMTLELAARFLTDAFEESYFTLEPSRYASLYDQNRAKAAAQLRLYADLVAKRRAIGDALRPHL